MKLERMSSMEVDAFYNYARALHEGKVEPPEGVTELGSSLEDTISRMVQMFTLFRQTDYNTVDDVRRTMAIVNPLFLEAALEYQPPQKYLM